MAHIGITLDWKRIGVAGDSLAWGMTNRKIVRMSRDAWALGCRDKPDRSRSSLPVSQDQKAQRMDRIVSNYSAVEIGYITDDSLLMSDVARKVCSPRSLGLYDNACLTGKLQLPRFTQRNRISVPWIARHRFSQRISQIWNRRMLEFSLRLATLNPS